MSDATTDEELQDLEDYAAELDGKGAEATDAYEQGRYYGKAEGIRFAADYFFGPDPRVGKR